MPDAKLIVRSAVALLSSTTFVHSYRSVQFAREFAIIIGCNDSLCDFREKKGYIEFIIKNQTILQK